MCSCKAIDSPLRRLRSGKIHHRACDRHHFDAWNGL